MLLWFQRPERGKCSGALGRPADTGFPPVNVTAVLRPHFVPTGVVTPAGVPLRRPR